MSENLRVEHSSIGRPVSSVKNGSHGSGIRKFFAELAGVEKPNRAIRPDSLRRTALQSSDDARKVSFDSVREARFSKWQRRAGLLFLGCSAATVLGAATGHPLIAGAGLTGALLSGAAYLIFRFASAHARRERRTYRSSSFNLENRLNASEKAINRSGARLSSGLPISKKAAVTQLSAPPKLALPITASPLPSPTYPGAGINMPLPLATSINPANHDWQDEQNMRFNNQMQQDQFLFNQQQNQFQQNEMAQNQIESSQAVNDAMDGD